MRAPASSRFDFAFIPGGPAAETVEAVKLGESLGYRIAWIPDQGFHRDPFVLLGLAAAATERIGLGVGITSPFTRLPMQIARAAGVIDEVSNGRFRLGLGTANLRNVVKPLGVRFERPVGRLRDSIDIVRRLLAGERVDFEGPDDHLTGVKLDFQPRPDIPIYIGTRGFQIITMSGRAADGVLVESLFNPSALKRVLECIQTGAEQAGRTRQAVDVVAWQLVRVTDDPPGAIAAAKPWIAWAIQVGPPAAMRVIGIDEEVEAKVVEAMNRGDRELAATFVTDDAVRSFMVIGTAADVTRQLTDIFDRGADNVCILATGPMNEVRDNLNRFAKDVMHAFD
jgi:5,10-methylenetetrahydromethanopterin reductase